MAAKLIFTLFSFGIYAWAVRTDPPEARAKAMLEKMTVDEKLTMLHGKIGPYVGNVAGNIRLGIPALNLNDGPQGFRSEAYPGSTTAFPSALSAAATWDPNSLFAYGSAMGSEFYKKGANVQLGPGLCVARVPRNGRNFEYISGEDPFLGYTLAQPYVKGVQSQGVIANAKHWVNNNQETNRMIMSSDVDERTRFEMYYPPFEGAIEAGVGSVMCSYNKINGVYSCSNDVTLSDLKEKLGFKGWVMSDWGATHNSSINQGLDQEMPGALFFSNSEMQKMLDSNQTTIEKIDDSVYRMLLPMYQMGIFDRDLPDPKDIQKNVTSPENIRVARELVINGSVLVKNDGGILPISREKSTKKMTIAVVGLAAHKKPYISAGGSGHVKPWASVSPFEAIQDAAPEGWNVVLVDSDDPNTAKNAVSSADLAIVVVGAYSTEGADRNSLSLDGTQDELINSVTQTLPPEKIIVSMSVPGAILTPWEDKVGAILVNFYAGIEGAVALAEMIFGKVSPAGRLPITFPNKDNETEFAPEQWPGIKLQSSYSEKLLIGYRWYSHHGVLPKYAFGHGLTYSTFSYSNLTTSENSISFNLQNTGNFPAAEVAQLYLGFPPEANEPPLQLKGFKKMFLQPKESTKITFSLNTRSFSVYDVNSHAWKKINGNFKAYVGASAADLRLKGEIELGSAVKNSETSDEKKDVGHTHGPLRSAVTATARNLNIFEL
mmetsp:Transcript_4435/g.8078  ORF Transcript_4435/g.8078 Transcript_4435/m.8078 type:complete len:716 (+) Transcript_4435:1-2148(+)